MIVLGGSLGGTRALRAILGALPPDFPETIAIALHRARQSEADDMLVHILQQDCALPVSEPVDKEPIAAAHVYVAPPDYHLLVEGASFSLSTDEPVQYARPSIDVLFESAADMLGSRLTAVVLTGANQDGARGARRVLERGGLVVVENPATAESEIMPLAALETTGTPHVYSAEEIGPFLVRLERRASA
jgi:two-component system chemotaxis response regulator CheB